MNIFYLSKNNDKYFDCLAGNTNFSISLNGNFAPCRHISLEERFNSIADYWNNSKELKVLKIYIKHKNNLTKTCKLCTYSGKCSPCFATYYKSEILNSSNFTLCKGFV